MADPQRPQSAGMMPRSASAAALYQELQVSPNPLSPFLQRPRTASRPQTPRGAQAAAAVTAFGSILFKEPRTNGRGALPASQVWSVVRWV